MQLQLFKYSSISHILSLLQVHILWFRISPLHTYCPNCFLQSYWHIYLFHFCFELHFVPSNPHLQLHEISFPIPLKECWNFEAVFQRNSAGIPEVNNWITTEFWWNSTEIPAEYYRRFCSNLPHVFQNYSNETPLIFWQKELEFLWNFCGTLMKCLWYFLEFGWYFDGILVVFWWNSSLKSNSKGLSCRI